MHSYRSTLHTHKLPLCRRVLAGYLIATSPPPVVDLDAPMKRSLALTGYNANKTNLTQTKNLYAIRVDERAMIFVCPLFSHHSSSIFAQVWFKVEANVWDVWGEEEAREKGPAKYHRGVTNTSKQTHPNKQSQADRRPRTCVQFPVCAEFK